MLKGGNSWQTFTELHLDIMYNTIGHTFGHKISELEVLHIYLDHCHWKQTVYAFLQIHNFTLEIHHSKQFSSPFKKFLG